MGARFKDIWGGCVTLTGPNNAERKRYEECGMPVFAWSAMAMGFVSGKYRAGGDDSVLSRDARRSFLCPANVECLRRAERIAEAHGVPVSGRRDGVPARLGRERVPARVLLLRRAHLPIGRGVRRVALPRRAGVAGLRRARAAPPLTRVTRSTRTVAHGHRRACVISRRKGRQDANDEKTRPKKGTEKKYENAKAAGRKVRCSFVVFDGEAYSYSTTVAHFMRKSRSSGLPLTDWEAATMGSHLDT